MEKLPKEPFFFGFIYDSKTYSKLIDKLLKVVSIESNLNLLNFPVVFLEKYF